MSRGPSARAAAVVVAVAALGSCSTQGYPEPGLEAAACHDGRDQDFDGLLDELDPDCQTFGRSCTADADCAGLGCGSIGAERACVPACADGCQAGWACDGRLCTCTPCLERCNGADDDCDGEIDESSCALGEVCDPARGCSCNGDTYLLPVDQVDVLFVVDETSSFAMRLARVAAEIERMVRILATGDADGDGEPERSPVRSLHVAVVTSDLGVGPQSPTVPSCDETGDDGVLRRPEPGCTAAGPAGIFAFRPVVDDIDAYAAAVRCALGSAAGGCGFESPLEAMLKALSPAAPQPWVAPDYVPPVFRGGEPGHGDGVNDGFLRAGSSLGIVLVTDENDCSTDTTELFSFAAGGPYAGVGLNIRCAMFADVLHPVSRYVEGLRALRADPRRIQFAALLGMPIGGEALGHDALLALPAMREVSLDGNRLVPACTDDAGLDAFPSRRIIELARGLECVGATTTLRSICERDYAPVIDGLLDRTVGAIDRRVCVARPAAP